ncbi:MAG: heme o synthase [Thermoanaerobaculia bacterium]
MTEVAAIVTRRGLADVVRDYLDLSKSRIVLMVLVTTAAGYWTGARSVDPILLLNLLLGTALVAGGTNALNQVWERHRDARMARTRLRPLPAGRISTAAATTFSVAISIAGIGWLAVAVNAIAAFLAFATLASYLFVYTPLKTRTTHCTVVGAAPGAVPPMIGYAAATGVVDATAWALFALLFAWQLPHFLALSWIYREDYGRGGFRMLSVVDPARVGRHAFAWSAALFLASLAPAALGAAGALYLVTAVAGGAAILWSAYRFARSLDTRAARALFHGSNLYLLAVMTFLIVG